MGHKKNILILVFIILNLIVFSVYAQEKGELLIKNYKPKEYNADLQNWDIVQDTSGIMYFANNNGVLKYDGVNWETIPLNINSIVRSLSIDSKGRIYVGAVDELGYLEPDSLGKMRYKSLLSKINTEDLNFKDVWFTNCIGEEVWFSTDKTILKYKNGEFKTYKTQNSFFYTTTNKNKVYTYIISKGIYEITEDSLRMIPYGDYFEKNEINVWAIHSPGKDKMFICSHIDGMYTYDFNAAISENTKNIIKKFKTEADSLMSKYRAYCTTTLENGNFAIGLIFGGVIILNQKGELVNYISESTGLQNNIITSLYKDQENNLWVSTVKGISKININSSISFWNEKHGMKGYVNAIIRFNNTLYLSNFEGILYVENNKVKEIPGFNSPGFAFLNFKNPDIPNKNILLFGTNLEGLLEIKNNKTIEILEPQSGIYSLHQSSKNPYLLYVGKRDGVLVVQYKNNTWKEIGNIEGINIQTRAVFEDNNEHVWLSNQGNKIFEIIPSDNILKPKKINTYTLNTKETFSTYINSFNNRLLFSNNLGLLRFNRSSKKFIPDSKLDSCFSDGSISMNVLQKDNNGNLWCSGERRENAGFALSTNKGDLKWIETPFNILPKMQVTYTYIDDDSTIWIAGSEGLFVYNGNFKIKSRNFNALITKIKIKNDSTLSLENKSVPSRIPYKLNSIKIKYAATSFYDESRTSYQIFLDGFDNDWQNWTNDTKKEYTNLPEGNYTIKLRAKNVYNQISKEATFNFSILPPWYRTNFAYISYIIGLALLIWLIVFLNAKRLKALNQELEETVKQRTHDLYEANTELEVQKEEIISQRDAIETQNKELEKHKNHLDKLVKVRTAELEKAKIKAEESDRLKSSFLANMSHEIRTPMNAIMGFSDLIIDPDIEPEDKEDLSVRITQNCNSLMRLIDDIIDISKIESNQLNIIKEKFSVKELLNEVNSIYKLKSNELQKDKLKFEIKENKNDKIIINSDKIRIRQVLINLLDNAFKFTEKGTIQCGFNKEPNSITFFVKDTGIGLKPEQSEEIFNQFRKIEANKSTIYRGAGLGLAISKNIIELLGGKIWVESTPGKGSTFYFTIQ